MSETTKTIRLLLVDDEEEFRRATAPALARRGFAVSEAGDGMAALATVERERPDVVVLDLKMPGLDGIETLIRLRESVPDLPVIILTGHGRYEDAVAGIRLDIVDFLQKPMDVDELAARVRRLLQADRAPSLREKTVAELMVPPERYPRIRADESVRRGIAVLLELARRAGAGSGAAAGGHSGREPLRSLLVFDAEDRFLGIFRFHDVLRLVLPQYLEQSPYSTYFTGMLLAQCKVAAQRPIGDVLPPLQTIDLRAPLAEAVHLMVRYGTVNLPVVDGSRLVGVLREKDLVAYIAESTGAV